MLYNFNQYINESKEDEFRSLEKGDIILYAGARYKVKTANEYAISLTPIKKAQGADNKALKANLAQYKERGGGIIEKAKKEEDED